MTSISIAVKKETPQVVGPFTVTAADLVAAATAGGGYAHGLGLFTPAAGSLVLAAWVKVTEAWLITVNDGSACDANAAFPLPDFFFSGSVGQSGAASTPVGIADGTTEIRAYPVANFAASAGAFEVRFLVVPTG